MVLSHSSISTLVSDSIVSLFFVLSQRIRLYNVDLQRGDLSRTTFGSIPNDHILASVTRPLFQLEITVISASFPARDFQIIIIMLGCHCIVSLTRQLL
jgi:hypothetical protein